MTSGGSADGPQLGSLFYLLVSDCVVAARYVAVQRIGCLTVQASCSDCQVGQEDRLCEDV